MADHAIIAGPAVIEFNSHSFWTDPGGVELTYERNLFIPRTANHGAMGARHTGTLAKISFTPAGHVTVANSAKFWPYTQADIGKLCKTTLGAALDINPQPNQGMKKHSFTYACITKLPSLKLSANSLAWSGKMEFTAWGDPTKSMTDAGYWTSVASAADAADVAADETEFPSPRVLVAYGSTPYDVMEVDDSGVMIDFNLDTNADLVSNYRGPLDKMIGSLSLVASFTPLNITEAQYNTLLALQDTGAARPGDFVGTTTSLVITCEGTSKSMTTVTLYNMGPGPGGYVFSADKWRQGQIQFHNRPKFTAGVPQPMYLFA